MQRALRRLHALLASAALCASCGREQAAGEPPLVVLVVVDTLRADALSCYGGPGGATPAIDALAARGLRFEQAIASSGWTLPSVASLLTGTWPEIHKAVGHRTLLSPVSAEIPLAAELFRGAGYATCAVVNAAFLGPELGLGRGFDVYDHEPAFNRSVRRASETVEVALALAARRAREPLFLLVHLFDPHLDYDPPPELAPRAAAPRPELAPPLSLRTARDLAPPGERPDEAELRHVRALYQAEVAEVDRAVARLVAGLEELGAMERALFVLVADHGEELWDHGGFEHGHSLHDELIRVPLILVLPRGRARSAAVVPEQVRTIDVAPTLLELCGIDAPATIDGESLLPLVEGRASASRIAFSQDTLYGGDQLSWRTERHQLLYDRGAGVESRVRLYDHRADPRCQVDLAEREPALAAELERDLARFYAELRERGERIEATSPRPMGPSALRELRESLESLGYLGRDE